MIIPPVVVPTESVFIFALLTLRFVKNAVAAERNVEKNDEDVASPNRPWSE